MGGDNQPRPVWQLAIAGLAVLFGLSALTSLGIWQIERRAWKLDLIQKVDTRIHAEAVMAPGPDAWPEVTTDHDAYRHVTAHGVFQNDKETLVQAFTLLGPGFWVITPLKTDEGFTVLVNRGFTPYDKREASARKDGQATGKASVTGLLRITEPKGRLWRSNDPANDLWYSRDVAAIAKKRGLSDVAPYFIDADTTPNPGGVPVGGMTVVGFANNHLIYAITWFSLDAMLAAYAVIGIRDERRRRKKT